MVAPDADGCPGVAAVPASWPSAGAGGSEAVVSGAAAGTDAGAGSVDMLSALIIWLRDVHARYAAYAPSTNATRNRAATPRSTITSRPLPPPATRGMGGA